MARLGKKERIMVKAIASRNATTKRLVAVNLGNMADLIEENHYGKACRYGMTDLPMLGQTSHVSWHKTRRVV